MKDTEPLSPDPPRRPPPLRLHPLLFPLLSAFCCVLVLTQASSFFFLLTRLEAVRERIEAAEVQDGRRETFLTREVEWLKTRMQDMAQKHPSARPPPALFQRSPPHPPPSPQRDLTSRVRRRASDPSYGVNDALGEVAGEDGELSVQLQGEKTDGHGEVGRSWLQLTSYSRIPGQDMLWFNAIKEFCSKTRESCPPGPMGPEGPLGPVGPLGKKGEPGLPGVWGDRGLPGQPGPLGPAGQMGMTGPPGQTGSSGEKGRTGLAGLDGRDGLPGEPGLYGIPGRDGLKGLPGVDGIPGTNGIPGIDGFNGTHGTPGVKGERGFRGPHGIRGIAGPRGRKGRNGKSGEDGVPGIGTWMVDDNSTFFMPPSIPGSTRKRPRRRRPIVVREGDNLRLRCQAAGKPHPIVVWGMDNGAAFPTGRWKDVTLESHVLNLTHIHREHMGVYRCEADNGIPPSDYKTFPIEVHFDPFIHVRPRKVWTYNGSSASLECHVEAFPVVLTYWEDQHGMILDNSSKYSIFHRQDRDVVWKSVMEIKILDIVGSDFGDYYCVARNEISFTRGLVQVHEIDPSRYIPSTGTVEGLTFGPKPPSFVDYDDLCPPMEDCPECPKCAEGRRVLFEIRVEKFGNIIYSGLKNRTTNHNCMLSAVGKPVFHGKVNVTYGSWMRDTNSKDTPRENFYWTTTQDNKITLKEFHNKNQNRHRDDQPNKVYTLERPFVGNSHVVYNGSFYYQEYNQPTLIRYDLASEIIKTVHMPELTTEGDTYLYQISNDYIDLSIDDNGLWAIYSPDPHNTTVVTKIDPWTLKIEHSWNISLNQKLYGNFFVACGVLYAVDSATERDTRIRIALDLYTEKLLDVDLAFNNPFRRTTMLGYNYDNKEIYSWDDGNQLTYPVKVIDIGYNTPDEDRADPGAVHHLSDYNEDEDYEVDRLTSS